MSPYIEDRAEPHPQSEPTSARHRISIPEAPITVEYPAHSPPANSKLVNSGVVQATFAPTSDAPYGTEKEGWAEKHQHQTVPLPETSL